MMISAEIRVRLNFAQLQRLVAAGFLPPNADCPGDLSDALDAVLDTLPMPPDAKAIRAGQVCPA